MPGIDGNTKLMLHYNGDFQDSSGNNHTVTPINNPAIGRQYFGSSAINFNGTSQYLTIPDSADWDIGSSLLTDYSIDCFCKFNTGSAIVITAQFPNDPGYWQFTYSGNLLHFNANVSGPAVIDMNGTTNINDSLWHHLAVIKVGSNWGLYIDGVQEAYYSQSTIFNITGPLYLGRRQFYNDWLFNGDMDELRFQKSNAFNANPIVGLTDTITVPTTEHTSDANTKLLLHYNDDLTDNSGQGHVVTNVNGAQFVSGKFITEGVSFNGTNQHLLIPNSSDFHFGLLDFTIDFHAKPNISLPSKQENFISQWKSASQFNFIFGRNTNGVIIFVYTIDGFFGSGGVATGSTVLSINYQHIALVRHGVYLKLFIDGIEDLGFSFNIGTDDIYNATMNTWIGSQESVPTQTFEGNMDELRISNVARWTSNFTPPQQEYTRTLKSQSIITI